MRSEGCGHEVCSLISRTFDEEALHTPYDDKISPIFMNYLNVTMCETVHMEQDFNMSCPPYIIKLFRSIATTATVSNSEWPYTYKFTCYTAGPLPTHSLKLRKGPLLLSVLLY